MSDAMEEEDISTTLDPSLPQGPGWRADLSRADRIKVCKLIVQKLHLLHNKKVPLEALRDVASRFEANTLRTTGSRKEYIKSIGYALINAEKQLKQNSPENADKKQKQTAGTSAAGRTKRCPKRPRSG